MSLLQTIRKGSVKISLKEFRQALKLGGGGDEGIKESDVFAEDQLESQGENRPGFLSD